METEKVFRTKTGYCHVLPDRIRLTRSGVAGGAAQTMVGNRIGRILVIYAVIALFAAYSSWKAFQRHDLLMTFVYAGLAAILVYNVVRSWNNSAASTGARVFTPTGARVFPECHAVHAPLLPA